MLLLLLLLLSNGMMPSCMNLEIITPALQADSLPSEARNHHPNNRHTHTHTRTQKNRLSASQNSYQNKSLRFAYKPSSCLPKSMTGDVILNISKSEWP